MSIGFPTLIVSLIVVLTFATAIGFWLILSEGIAKVQIAPRSKSMWRGVSAIVLSGWLAGYLALAVNPPSGTVLAPSITLPFFILGTLVAILPFLFSPVFRQIVMAAPVTWIVGLHVIRTFGSIWFALGDMKLIPLEFAIPSGIGDMAAGLLALWMVYFLVKRKPYTRTLVIGWNLLGVLDFALALTTGLTFIRPYAAQVAAAGVSTLYLNYVFLVPTVAIPLLTALHFYSLVQVLSGRVERTTLGGEAAAQAPVLS